MARAREDVFDPIEILRVLDRRRVAHIVVGALGRVIQGSDEITEGIDIVPSTKEENLRKLGHALEDLNARRVDGKPLALDEGLPGGLVLELETDAGELKVVLEPAGTRGYDDLRRDASREPLGSGLRPSVASLGDAARMLAALGREEDLVRLRAVRRVIELERQLGLGLEL